MDTAEIKGDSMNIAPLRSDVDMMDIFLDEMTADFIDYLLMQMESPVMMNPGANEEFQELPEEEMKVEPSTTVTAPASPRTPVHDEPEPEFLYQRDPNTIKDPVIKKRVMKAIKCKEYREEVKKRVVAAKAACCGFCQFGDTLDEAMENLKAFVGASGDPVKEEGLRKMLELLHA